MSVTNHTFNVAAGATESVSFNFTEPTGYKAIAYMFCGISTANLVATDGISSYMYSLTRSVTFRNVSSSTYTGKPTITGMAILVKTDMNGGNV